MSEKREFDFYGKIEEQQRKETQKLLKQKRESFLKIGRTSLVTAGIAIVLAGGGFGAYDMYQTHLTNEINTVEKNIRSVDTQQLLGLISKEKELTQRTFAENQLLINNFGAYKELVEVLNMQNDVAAKNAANSRLYKQTTTSLDNDLVQVNNVLKASSGTRDDKIHEYLDSTDIQKLNAWENNLKNNQFMYVGGMIDLNKDLNKQLKFLDETQKEVIQNVKERLKNKDYNLDDAQVSFNGEVQKSAQAQIDDLKQARNELKDTEQQMRDNDEDPSQISNILTDKDVQAASDAMGTVQQEAVNQIKDDGQKVESLIAQANAGNSGDNNNQAAQLNSSIQPTQVVYVNSGSHMTFADYYLMYNWMNSSSPSYNTTVYHTTTTAGAPQTRTYQPVAALSRNNPYDLKSDNSYISRSLNQRAAVSGNASLQGSLNKMNSAESRSLSQRTNLSSLRNQIQAAKVRATQVRSVRQAELSRMSGGNRFESGGKSGGKLGSTSRSSSHSMSEGGHSSFSHSGGFGGHAGGVGG